MTNWTLEKEDGQRILNHLKIAEQELIMTAMKFINDDYEIIYDNVFFERLRKVIEEVDSLKDEVSLKIDDLSFRKES